MHPLACNFSKCLGTSTFSDNLKMTEILLVPVKGQRSKKRNHKPISILPTVSRVFEKKMTVQQLISF